jgi:O-methyltransferase domain
MGEDGNGVRLVTMGLSYQLTWVITVLARLRLPDLLDEGTRTVADLAAAVDADTDALRRLLRAAASAGLVEQEPGERFRLTELGACLRTGPISLHGFAVMVGDTTTHRVFEQLERSVRTGAPAAREALGMDLGRWYATHPETVGAMAGHMEAMARLLAERVPAAWDASRSRCVVDLGGTQGILLAALLGAAPEAAGVLVEPPPGLERARGNLAGVVDRVRLVPGAPGAEVPAGGDLYLLKQLLHDRDHDRAVALLRRCRDAMDPDGAILLLEGVLPADGPGQTFAHLMDLSMLVLAGGRERTMPELSDLCRAAGLELRQTVRTPLPFWPDYYLMEVRPA